MTRVLITAFQAFQGETINPSSEIIPYLQLNSGLMQEALKLQMRILPVSYRNSFKELTEVLSTESFDFVLMLGQAGGRSEVQMERVALNWTETSLADEDGVRLDIGPIDHHGPPAFFSSLQLSEWQQEAKQKGLPLSVSHSAGTFVCNYLYYQCCQILTKNQQEDINRFTQGKCLFVHLPYLPEQKHNDKPNLELKVQTDCIIFILENLLKNNANA